MNKLFILPLFIFSLIFTVNIFGQPFDMILTGDPVLEDIRFLSLVTNSPFLSFSPPLAPAEIKHFLDKIDESSLSLPAREAYFRVLNRLSPQANLSWEEGIFKGSLNINTTLVGRTKFNSDISWYPHYPKIVPFAAFPLKLSFADVLQLYIEPSAAIRPGKYGKEDSDFNIPTDYYTYNESNPLRAFAAAGNSWLSFQIGRDRLYWGSGHTGSLVFSDNSQFFDFARLSIFGSTFKYSLIVNQMQLELKPNLFRENSDINTEWLNDKNNMTRSIHRYYYLHRFDINFKNKVTIGIMEGVMAGNSPLELKYFNPMMFFHALFSWEDYDSWEHPLYEDWGMADMNGSILSLEINWNVLRNLGIYGQFVLNDFSAPGEEGEQPNGLGYMAGIQYAHSFRTWASIFFLEFFYTDPYLNLLSSPFASFIQMDRFDQYYFIGYPRDTISLTFGTRFFYNDTLSISGSFSWITSGELNRGGLKWDWEYSKEARNKVTPTGIAENKYILSLGAGWRPHPFVLLKADVTGIVSVNNNHVNGETVLGGQASLSAGFHY